MRCRQCNVDLSETYSACPLCGGKASPDAPVLQGIRTAEYPKVKTEPYKRNPFPIFIGAWLIISLVAFVLYRLHILSDISSAAVICAVPCIWTLLLRPFLIKQLYAGNYIVMNLFPLSLACVVFDRIKHGAVQQAVESYLPVCCLAVLAALAVLILIKPKESKRAASYPVLLLPVCVIAIIAVWCMENKISVLWCAAALACICILAFLLVIRPQETKEELEAKFSIQKSVESHKI